MTYKCALLCMHGMGNLSIDEFRLAITKLRQNLAERLPEDLLSKVYIPPSGIFYSSLTQGQEDKAWNAMVYLGGLNTGFIRKTTVSKLRRFILSGFSDATAFIGTNTSDAEDLYTAVQSIIIKSISDIYSHCGPNTPIIIISQSLGGQILSSYIWDAQNYLLSKKSGSIVKVNPRSYWANHESTNDEHDSFLCLQSLKTLLTTGCNIPIFVSGFQDIRAIYNKQYGYNFNWFNFFDYDDLLGYPLSPLGQLFGHSNENSHGQSYADAVLDIQINANNGILGAITSSWNPFSHTQYWEDEVVLNAIAKAIT